MLQKNKIKLPHKHKIEQYFIVDAQMRSEIRNPHFSITQLSVGLSASSLTQTSALTLNQILTLTSESDINQL